MEERGDIKLEWIRSTFWVPHEVVRNNGGTFVIGLPALDDSLSDAERIFRLRTLRRSRDLPEPLILRT